MLIPPKEFNDWKVTTVGDDIAWIQNGGRRSLRSTRRAILVAPVNYETNPNAMETISANTMIFTNVAP